MNKPEARMATGKYRVLLVDDDSSLLRLLSIRIAYAGYAVETVESGEQALERLPIFHPHLIITDLRMGGMDGMALFDHVHRDHPALPVLVLTAHGSETEASAAIERGVYSYMTKPYNSKVLLAQVAAALETVAQAPIEQAGIPSLA